jgi:hypothetical protein
MQNIESVGVSQGALERFHGRGPSPLRGDSGSGAAAPATSSDRPLFLHCGYQVALPRTAEVSQDETLALRKKRCHYSITSSARASRIGYLTESRRRLVRVWMS